MASARKLKRQILRQAVAENVGGPRTPPRRPGAPAPRRGAAIAAGALLVAAIVAGLGWRAGLGARGGAQAEAPAPASAAAGPHPVRLVLDPGHGGDDLGAVVGDQVEKALTLDLSQRLRALLEEAGYEVFLTREDDRALALRERVEIANAQRADAFVSIHLSRIGTGEAPGIETYYLGPTTQESLEKLARQENRDSGYSLGDLRKLLEGIYTHPRREDSRRLAQSVQRALYRSLLPVDPDLRDLGASTAPFVVLVATEMPAILAEVSCLSTGTDSHLLGRPRYRDHIAQALFRGIESYAPDTSTQEGEPKS